MHMCDESCLQEERHGKHTTLSGGARAGGEGRTSRRTNNTTRCPLPQDCPIPECKSLHAGFGCNMEPESFATHLHGKKKKKITAGRSGQLYINAPWHFIMCTVILVSKHSAHMLWFLWITSSPPPQIVHRVPCRGNNSHLALKLEQSI